MAVALVTYLRLCESPELPRSRTVNSRSCVPFVAAFAWQAGRQGLASEVATSSSIASIVAEVVLVLLAALELTAQSREKELESLKFH